MEKIIIDLTQEQINTMVHDSCVLFCKYCGCGIPRETCTSLGTCKKHDEYRVAIRTHLMEKKKNKYPKTYEECCKVLGIEGKSLLISPKHITDYERDLWNLMGHFRGLIICRDAYWKIAGEEMGLGKPWEPDWKNDVQFKYVIICRRNCVIKDTFTAKDVILAFPTAEMQDAFYENFKELIETVKELL